MPISEIIQNILNATYLLGIIFAIFLFFRRPQEKTATTEAVLRGDIAQLKADLANLRDNHIHTLAIKTDETNKTVQDLALQVTRIATIIEERIPLDFNKR